MNNYDFLKPDQFLSIDGNSYARYFVQNESISDEHQKSLAIPEQLEELNDTMPTRLAEPGFAFFFQWPSKIASDGFLYVYSLGIADFRKDHSIDHSGGESYLFVFTYSGTGKLKYNNEVYTVCPSDAFIIDCRKPHSYWSEKSWGYYAIYFDGKPMNAYGKLLQEYKCCCFPIENNSPIFLSIRQIFHVNDEVTPLLEIENNNALTYIMTEIVHIAHSRVKTPDIINDVCIYLKEHMKEQIKLDDISKKFYINKFHLSHKFEKYIGESPIAYLNRERINMAQYYLVTTDKSISEIAEMVGINSGNHFLYLFRRFNNTTPSVWRKTHSLKESKL